ncbi:MAG TPA: hypothetical protein VII43_02675 [Opitutaceae bacterium]
MESESIPDFVEFVKAAGKWTGDELDLGSLQDGDRLLIRTKNTSYLFAMTGPHAAMLKPNRADRPSGPVRIQGCIYGQSKMIKPGHLFCGGGLEIRFDEDKNTVITTAIEAIQLLRRSAPAGA